MYKSYTLTDYVQFPCPYLEQTVDGRGGALTEQTHPLFEQRLVIQLTRTLTGEAGGGQDGTVKNAAEKQLAERVCVCVIKCV